MKFILVLFTLVISCQLAWTQNAQCLPRNEVAKDPGLQKFVNTLLQAIEKRDEVFILSVLDQEVSSNIEGEGGIAEFKKMWEPEKDSSLMWMWMKRVIDLGGVFLHDAGDETGRYQFVFPYVYDMDLNLEDDYFNLGVITGKNVNLREKPDTKSSVVSQLTYDLIWYLNGEEYGKTRAGTNPFGDAEWYQIETYDHAKRGWVNWKYIYSPMNYRLFLYKTAKGEWKISAFLAGD